jgi:pilus assembly protein Flp/PilA
MFGMISSLVAEFLADESGATAIEYGVVALFIGSGLVIVIESIGTSLDSFFQSVADGF